MPNLNNAVGVLNELLLSYHLCDNGSFAAHFRTYDRSPEVMHDIYREQVGEDAYSVIFKNTLEMSSVIRSEFVQAGLMANTVDVESVTWTSLRDTEDSPGDHERLTGVRDPNADGDIAIGTSRVPQVFVSAKYGRTRAITLRGVGRKALEGLTGASGLAGPMEAHRARMRALGFVGTQAAVHETCKASRGTELGTEAERSGMRARAEVASIVRAALESKGPDQLRELVLELIAPSTVYPHWRTHTVPSASKVEHHAAPSRADAVSKIDQYSDLHVADNPGRTTVRICGSSRYDGSVCTLASIGIKFNSGPASPWVANFTSPMLNRRRKRRTLYAFDMDDTMFWYEAFNQALVSVIGPEGQNLGCLTAHDWAEYVLAPGESYDYSEFQSVSLLSDTANPIGRVLSKMKSLRSRKKDVVIVTARGFMDDVGSFDAFLSRHGLPSCRCHWSGERGEAGPTSAVRKRAVLSDLIREWGYDEVHFYDDSPKNIESFLSLSSDFPDVELVAWLVSHDPLGGKTKIKRIAR